MGTGANGSFEPLCVLQVPTVYVVYHLVMSSSLFKWNHCQRRLILVSVMRYCLMCSPSVQYSYALVVLTSQQNQHVERFLFIVKLNILLYRNSNDGLKSLFEHRAGFIRARFKLLVSRCYALLITCIRLFLHFTLLNFIN